MLYIVHCPDVYNLAQKLDNSVQIVKITGHAWRTHTLNIQPLVSVENEDLRPKSLIHYC